MVDPFLALFVVLAPTLFALAIECVNEEMRKSHKWHIGIVAFGILLSSITYWQQSRDRNASASERESAIKRTAAETSEKVTAGVTDRFKQTVADLQKENTALQAKLDVQAKDVATIKNSNIVTGKGPIAVKITNSEANTIAALGGNQTTISVNDARYTKNADKHELDVSITVQNFGDNNSEVKFQLGVLVGAETSLGAGLPPTILFAPHQAKSITVPIPLASASYDQFVSGDLQVAVDLVAIYAEWEGVERKYHYRGALSKDTEVLRIVEDALEK
jgi:hypothetical protein